MLLIDEPDIVRELRRDESDGKLHLWTLDEDPTISKMGNVVNVLPNQEEKTVKNYDDAFILAKKAFKEIKKSKI
jgi:hypothetical protein